MSAGSGLTAAVAEVLVKVSALLHACRCTRVPVRDRAVDYIKPAQSFIQSNLEVGTAAAAEIGGAPFDVEDSIGRSACYRGEDA